jgi:hypothetical protein
MYPMELFVKGLQVTRRYKARFGQANAKFEYKAITCAWDDGSIG